MQNQKLLKQYTNEVDCNINLEYERLNVQNESSSFDNDLQKTILIRDLDSQEEQIISTKQEFEKYLTYVEQSYSIIRKVNFNLTSLQYSIQNKNYQLCELIMNFDDLDVNILNQFNQTSLHLAAINLQKLEHGDEEYDTILKVIEQLKKRNINVDIQDVHNKTAYDYYPLNMILSLGVIIYELMEGQPPDLDLNNKNNMLYFSKDYNQDIVNLVISLLKKNPQKRLGVNGIKDFQQHSFFQGFEWDKIYQRFLLAQVVKQLDLTQLKFTFTRTIIQQNQQLLLQAKR
ncbi:Protein kinase-like domain [Pseudocohnilembus persalinus]|uniref:Protein kinase-like domain n=1 Tax=Pseudocohnilembus persalinus TaxID=266149 RepID=A0A0V0QF00_PSEPJ|nr:Protein kinase-like domain [Pseudocohnilembus persalinus]|eukprot:KRX00704.1 Protein kinase-like domain [Pseudocohnilembus persalinus]